MSETEVRFGSLKADLEELEQLLGIAKQKRIIILLKAEKAVVEKQLQQLNKAASPRNVVPTVTITSYAWDQSEKFVKIYLSNLGGIQNIDPTNVTLNTKEQPNTVNVKNLKGKNYVFQIPKLAHAVEEPTIKIKTDMILIMLKKQELRKWDVLTDKERIKKEENTVPLSKQNEDADPSQSIMHMMKKMYDDGDDEMKRTIAKAWTQSREKNEPML
uniref:Calcyclin-binding protein n=1 Tax=Phallusia mammillata TaxID=59560 RepID=A0A6F9D7H1_9ASCI|nr:calcyclin-binding protein-like [Phallusia mammillata]